jgi:nodulation protein E
MNRVAVTGLGAVSALGKTVSQHREALLAGRSMIAPLKLFPTDGLQIKIGAEVLEFDPRQHFSLEQLHLYDRVTQLALLAAQEAVQDSQLDFKGEMGNRTAAIIGTGAGAAQTCEDSYNRHFVQKRRAHPLCVPKAMMNAPASHVSMVFGIRGPSFVTSSACASAGHAIALAVQMIRHGMVDIAVTGGAEACLNFSYMAAWEGLRIMASDTCRPFSCGRLGMALGEGAAIFVLENLSHARSRGATVYAELAGTGMSSDASHIVLPALAGPVEAIRRCLQDAECRPEDVGYINAHGTGTTANDTIETRAIRTVFGTHAEKLCVSSTKAMHGHLLGGAAAIELLATILAMRHGFLPPTVNYVGSDPECDLDYVPNTARKLQFDVALSNSFAFGGHNVVLAIRRPS